MKIGIMARAIDAIDGPGVGTKNLIDGLLTIDKINKYVIFYRSDKHFGRYSNYTNVKEKLIRLPHKLLWDQLAVPYYAWREGVDIIFHTKFTVPFMTKVPTISILRGSEWFIYPDFYSQIDITYVKLAMPRYCSKATKLVCVSNIVREDMHKYAGAQKDKMITIYNAANEHFKKIKNIDELQKIKKKYDLPDKFVLTVSRGYHLDFNTKKAYPGKNLEVILKAYLETRKKISCNLVIAGKNMKEHLFQTMKREFTSADGIYFVGYIPQEDLPGIYNLAELFLFPSFYEAFPIPLVEALACGCPIITSKTGGCPEIVGDDAILVDPDDKDEIAAAITRVMSDDSYRAELAQRSLLRGKKFSWEKTARKTLQLIETVYKETCSRSKTL